MTPALQHSDWLNGRVPDDVRVQLRRIVEIVGYLPYPQPMAVVTADGVLLAANQPLLDLLRASRDELLDDDWDDYLPGWTERATGALSSRWGEPDTMTFSDYVSPRGGEPLWANVVACPVMAPPAASGGNGGAATAAALAAWALFIVDASPRDREAEERRRREILELLLESPSEFVVQLTSDGRLDYVSPSFCRLLGVPPGGAGADDLGAAAGLPGGGFGDEFSSLLESLLGAPYRAEVETTVPTVRGPRLVHWAFESLLADRGEVKGILGIGRDVTERRRADEERERSETRLRTIVEATHQLIWSAGPDGEFDSSSETWTAFTGQRLADAAGDGWIDAVHPEDRERVVGAWRAAVASGQPFASEHRLRTAAGDHRWIAAHAVPLPDGAGYFGVGQDVTERRLAEEAVRRRLELESMISAISARVAGARFESAPEIVDFALGEVGRHIGGDRISLFELGPDGARVLTARVWRRRTGAVSSEAAEVDFEAMTWLRQRLLAGETVAAEGLDDVPAEAVAERAAFERLGLGAILVVPLANDESLAGFLTLDVPAAGATERPQGPRWGDDDVGLLRLLADQLAGLVFWQRDEENLRYVSSCILDAGSDVDAAARLCQAAAEVTGASFSFYSRRSGQDLVTVTGWGLPEDFPERTPAEGRVCDEVMSRPEDGLRFIRDLTDAPWAKTSQVVKRYGVRTYVGLPVVVNGTGVATLTCMFTTPVVLRQSQLELLRVLGQAASVEEARRRAIEDRLQGLAELEQAMERTVGTLSGAMSARDPYTAGHARRVAALVSAIGAELGLEGEDLRLLRLAGTVHDIGKIAVPAELLNKPARLSATEFAIIQEHCEAGHRLLEPAALPERVADAVLHHHERLDGSGYPSGLVGEAIGDFARVVAVADVVEAMASHRPHRPAVGVQAALDEIEAGSGTLYDPEATAACLRVFRERGFAFED